MSKFKNRLLLALVALLTLPPFMQAVRTNIIKLLRKRFPIHLFFLASVTMLASSPTVANTIILRFDSLPGEQGWSFYDFGGAVPADVFSTDGTQLRMDTMGLPFGSGDSGAGVYYKMENIVNDVEPYTLTVEARVTEIEGDVTHPSFGGALQFAVDNGNNVCAFAITLDSILHITSPTALISDTIDNTVFHQYRMEGGPSGDCDFYVDDQWISRKTARVRSTNRILLGDSTNPTNAKGDIRSYVFQQGTDSTGANASFTQADIDTAKTVGIAEGRQACIDDPESCGISVTECQENTASCSTTTEAVTLSSDLRLHIPLFLYNTPFGVMPLWADMQYTPIENRIMFEVVDYGDVEQATTP